MKFFRIILLSITKKSHLDLPDKFVRKNGENLPDIVMLEVHGGRKWRVELGRVDDQVWLRKGWPEFAMCLGLKPGHILVFDFEPVKCVFRVDVFDWSTCEVEHPAVTTAGHGNAVEVPEPVLKRIMVEENDQKIKEEGAAEIVRKAITSESESMRVGASRDYIIQLESGSGCLLDPEPGNGARVQKCGADMKEIRTVTPKRRARMCLEQACKFDSSNTSFCVKLLQSSLAGQRLTIPKSFWQQCPELSSRQVKLRVLSSGRTWLVNCRSRIEKFKGSRQRRSELCGGFKAFAEDNKLREGDLCVFELVDKQNGVFNVHISISR